MLFVPAARELLAKLAVPALTAPVPSRLPPSRNCTVPVAVFGETVAVNVIDCPDVEGSLFDVTTTLDGSPTPCPASPTTCGLPPLLSVKLRVADRAPIAWGVNVTPTTQFESGPTDAPQVLV
jgi:hypothetical protein